MQNGHHFWGEEIFLKIAKSSLVMWVFHHMTKAPDYGFLGVGLKNLLSPRHSVRVGSCRLGP